MIKFKKITAIVASALIAGLTMGTAFAANYPAPFITNGAGSVAVVYGTGVGVSQLLDQTGAGQIQADLTDYITSSGSSAVTAGDIKLTEDEITLGGVINATGSKILTAIEDNKLSSLVDEKFSWDDGSGSDDYNIHEEIALVGNMKVLTTLDDPKLTGVALSNEEALEYKLVFDDAITNLSKIGDSESDTLYLNLMGTEYEIEAVTATSVTVTTSQEVSMTIGQEYTINGKKVVLIDVYDGSVQVSVDGKEESIDLSDTSKINGIRVNVKIIGYHSSTPETSKAILKIGEDISKTFDDGDEFVGQDKDDPLWVWDITNISTGTGYIGVKYNAKIDSANDNIAGDSIKYIGEGYVFPNNYAAVTLDSITGAVYQDVKVYFEDAEDLFAASDTSTAIAENKPVLVIEAAETDSITVNSIETNKMYVWFNATSDKFETYYRDFDGDYTPTNKMRLANANALAFVPATSNVTIAQGELATIAIGDTNLDVDMVVTAGVATLIITNDDGVVAGSNVLNLTLDGTTITNITAGTLERLGTLVEDAQAGDVYFNNVDVSTEDYDYMDTYGIKLSDGTTVQIQADADEVTLSVPEEQVYAQVTVSMGATVEEATQLGAILAKDTESDKITGKNLVVVGGSCINAIAASLLGSSTPICGPAFTAKTGIGAGQAIIKAYQYGGKTALLVAGYDVTDTSAAVSKLMSSKPDTSQAWTVTTASQAIAEIN